METKKVKCEACGVTKIGSKENPVFQTWLSGQGKAPHMSAEAFYAKCCVHAKKPGCINQIESDAKPEDFETHTRKIFGIGTDDFLYMAKELLSDMDLPNEISEN